MNRLTVTRFLVTFLGLLLAACSTPNSGGRPPVDTLSAAAGAAVTRMGTPVNLLGTPLQVGAPLPSATLIDAFSMKKIDPAAMKGSVLLLSVVPSIDTKVCESQTHYLGEEGGELPPGIVRITVSRDTPFAQKRFALEAGLTGITYLSDYRDGSFGRATGLLQDDSLLLARAVIVVDRQGVVRYLQVVPELSHLPDMERAFAFARTLLGEK